LTKAPNRRKPVRPVRKSSLRRWLRRENLWPGLIIAGLIACACLYVWQQLYVMELTCDVKKLRDDNAHLSDMVKKAGSEITEMSSLATIEKRAAEELELTRTTSANLFTVIGDDRLHETDGLERLFTSLKKVADHLPVISETRAATMDIFDQNEK